eukprot:GHRQ01022317.1.p1 GENE.GHRQ01022317.1~~GHRQ01022317.1.p1  ORF type:complete len:275 (+),score=55.90 GHRQ01022317.1:116-940(+)
MQPRTPDTHACATPAMAPALQTGPLSKVMCCTKDEAAAYKKDMLGVVKTHVAPSYAVHPRTGDAYAPYNKPEAVIDWLAHVTPKEEWIVVLDSDMLLRRPFVPSDFNMSRGWATGARYDYMIGVDNELADRHIPEIPKVNDTLAGPAGRRSDRVGGFYFIRRDDLKAVAPLWLKYTEDVRADPEASARQQARAHAHERCVQDCQLAESAGRARAQAQMAVHAQLRLLEVVHLCSSANHHGLVARGPSANCSLAVPCWFRPGLTNLNSAASVAAD